MAFEPNAIVSANTVDPIVKDSTIVLSSCVPLLQPFILGVMNVV
jgi:hypothetical protein